MSDLTLVGTIKLTAGNPTEKRILDYLNENASEVLAGKINAGKKTLAGALSYAKGEAKELGAVDGCVCVDDATVFGWIVHFFEEDEIAEPKERAKVVVRTPAGVKKPVKAKGQRAARTENSGATKTEDGDKKPVDSKPEKSKGPIFLELFSMDQIQVVKK